MPNLPVIRPHILAMPGYEPVLPVNRLAEKLGLPASQMSKLDANENPYAPFEFVQNALASLENSNRYPDPENSTLRTALAGYHSLPVENILAGAGADDLIDLIIRLFISPGDVIINCPPTFGMYRFDADIQQACIVDVPRKPDFAIDVQTIEKLVVEYKPKLLFITSPNNPDGSLLAPVDLERLLGLPVLLVLDEAYIEFAPPGSSAIRKVLDRQNLVVLRTFSKWAGLAGLRVGYGVFPLWMMEQLWKIKQPYNLSIAGETAGTVSIQNADFLNDIAEKIIEERDRLFWQLFQLDWMKVYPSHSNFILCRLRSRDARLVKMNLAQKGVLVRYFNKPGLEDCIRISVGLPADTDLVIKALKSLG